MPWKRKQGNRWVNGDCTITDGVIDRLEKKSVQRIATELTGEVLPEEAFSEHLAKVIPIKRNV